MSEGNGDNGNTTEAWGTYKRQVIGELKRFNTWMGKLDDGQNAIKRELVALKLKAGIWGMVAGAIPVLTVLAVMAIGWLAKN